MSIFRQIVTYQDYPCKAVEYRRSDGLMPEPGAVWIDMTHVGKIRMEQREIPWRAVSGFEFDGMIDIRTWDRFKGGGTTTGDRPAIPAPAGGGFNFFGDLVMRTETNAGDKVDEIVYKDVYVDYSGIEEVLSGLANAQDHESGTVKVNLSDIRRYYRDYGGFMGRINCRLKSGEFDTDSIKSDGKTPWSLQDALEFLFSQLPGSPPLEKESDLFNLAFDAPSGIEGRGESAAEHIDRLLERYGLKAQMQPKGTYAISRRGSKRIAFGDIATAVRQSAAGTFIHDEHKTSGPLNRPPAVWVLGPRKHIRATVPYAPALQDVDGMWYKLEDLVSRYGYSMGELNLQVLGREEGKFDNIQPPNPNPLHTRRQRILANAYRHYLPAFLLKDGIGISIAEQDLEQVPMLPMVPCPWYRSELQDLSGASGTVAATGDLGEYTLLPAIARGVRIAQGFFPEWDDLTKAFDGKIEANRAQIGFFEFLKGRDESAIKEQLKFLGELDEITDVDQAKAAKFGVTIPEISIGADLAGLAGLLGQTLSQGQRLEATPKALGAIALIDALKKSVTRTKEIISNLRELEGNWKKEFSNLTEQWHDRRGVKALFNSPQDVLANVDIDTRSGLLKSNVPLVHAKAPVFFDGDYQEVAGDGNVVVTYAYELKFTTMSAFTNFLFKAGPPGPDGTEGKPQFAGSARSSPIKAKTVAMESRLYLQENGNAFNYTECYSEAAGRASGALSMGTTADGYVNEYSGLRKCVLDAGIVTIQHVWRGAEAHTHVAINAPHHSMPLHAANAIPARPTITAFVRETLQRDLPDGQ